MGLKFQNITISGGVGVGTTTLLNHLKPYLKPEGWKFKSAGQIIREYMREKIMPVATLVTDEYDRQIEAETKKLLQDDKHWIIEAWLAGFVAREFKDTLRILLICSSEAIRIDRVVNRDGVSVEDAKKNIKMREEENFKKWKKIYGDYDFFDLKYYNLVIDTYSRGPMETLGIVLDKLGYKTSTP
ncbi:MAG: cytidylate kinase family protein [Candidatus Roizmanbacteria bacterium]|nr:MAG: cytidylate kinase family protein [Candidatus Roizmanbacteria bacterium]